LTIKWKGVLIRFAEKELENIDGYCDKYSLKRSDFIRNSIRDKIYNADPITGGTREKDNPVDFTPLTDSVNLLSKKFESLESKLGSNFEEKETADSTVKERIIEAILQVMQRVTDPFTTTEKLAEQIKRTDRSLEQFFFASATNAISRYNEALTKLHQEGKLRLSANGIVEFLGGAIGAQRKKNRLQ
jgi:hypothetical protein